MNKILNIHIEINNLRYTLMGLDTVLYGDKSFNNYLKLFGFTTPLHNHELIRGDIKVQIKGSVEPLTNGIVAFHYDKYNPNAGCDSMLWQALFTYYAKWVKSPESVIDKDNFEYYLSELVKKD